MHSTLFRCFFVSMKASIILLPLCTEIKHIEVCECKATTWVRVKGELMLLLGTLYVCLFTRVFLKSVVDIYK